MTLVNGKSTEPFYREGHHYEVDPDTGCWNWLLTKWLGYARYNGGGAHRKIYVHTIGPIPEKHDVHHACHNPACVNPAHLIAVERGHHRSQHRRRQRGNFTAADILSIRERAAAGEVLRKMAAEYGVTDMTISYIVNGVMWASVGGPIGVVPLRTCALEGCEKDVIGPRTKRYCCKYHKHVAYLQRRDAA